MSERLIFLDTETGGLSHDARPWEVALVIEHGDQPLEQHLIHISDFEPADADPAALDIGGFYDRHPLWTPDANLASLAVSGPDLDLPVYHQVMPEAVMVRTVERLTRRAVVIGCNVGYDTFRILEHSYVRHGFAPTWHYRPVCATTYAASRADQLRAAKGEAPLTLPWKNEVIGAALGISRDGYGVAHTGLADAHYARSLFHAARGVWESA